MLCRREHGITATVKRHSECERKKQVNWIEMRETERDVSFRFFLVEFEGFSTESTCD